MILKIHQTSKTKELDLSQRDSAQSIQNKNPELEYFFWDDKSIYELVEMKFPEIVAIWNDLIGIQKADLGRYIILYEFGGFYADTDIFTEKNFLRELELDSFHTYFAPSTRIWPWEKPTLTNYFIYCPRIKDPFISSLISESVKRIKSFKGDKDFRYVPRTTGRVLIVDVAKKHANVLGLDSKKIIDKFCGCTKIPKSCVAYHAGSTTRDVKTWHKNYSLMVVKLECNIRKLLRVKGNFSQAPFFLLISVIILISLIFLFVL